MLLEKDDVISKNYKFLHMNYKFYMFHRYVEVRINSTAKFLSLLGDLQALTHPYGASSY